MSIYLPDLALRQWLTFAATFPLLLSHSLYAGSTRHPPKHVHFQAVSSPIHLVASLEVCGTLDTVTRSSKHRQARILEFPFVVKGDFS